jgi:signal transduction histidine kinase
MADEVSNSMDEEPPARILIVDDVADNRAILGRRFQRRGFEVAEAESGLAALAAIDAGPFDLVLLDVMMPQMNGIEALRRIRERFSALELPVIMVTGKSDSHDIVEALSQGANDYITKPVDFAVALARVTTQVGRRRAEEHVRRANLALSEANRDLELRIAARTVELTQSNADLRVAMSEAQAANRAKDEFMLLVSHELRTPLNGLMVMGELLVKTPLNDKQRKMGDIINTSASALNGIVSDLLDMMELNSGEMILAPTVAPLGELVRQAAAQAETAAAAKGLAFKFDIAPDAEAPVHADPARVKQILANLLDNAVKFTEAGEVGITVMRPPADSERVVLTVHDTGVGFDPAISRRLFRPFEQADGSLTRKFGGNGLGLAICHSLVELMGGEITADSEPGVGSSFRVELSLPNCAKAVAA